ncbi:MAG: hypothetical protein H8D67_10780 [Deltaproteobacteria bacterium]|nr:hypothetical protein [Deltaproteobacteria bacterium]
MSRVRVCFDSNIFCRGILAQWGAPKAVLILAASGLFDLILLEPVIDEVEGVLASYGRAINDFHKLLQLCRVTRIRSPSKEELAEHTYLLPYLRHLNDLPVIVSAIFASPDWFLSDNVYHFSQELADVTEIKIVSSIEFLRQVIIPR